MVTDGEAADVAVLVVAEAVKPEDSAAGDSTLMVLNKADLLGGMAGERAAQCRALTGVPTVPMAALLADVTLDDEAVAALRALSAEPADLSSTDAFVQCPHRLPREVRARLLERLDRFGIATAVAALGRGVAPEALPAVLRKVSGVDDVVAAVHIVAAPARYRRVRSAVAELQALAVHSERVAEFLASDDAVVAVMAAAVDVVEAAGLDVDRGDGPAAHLRRAVHWRRYSRGPVDALHRTCGADIARGSLRLVGRVL